MQGIPSDVSIDKIRKKLEVIDEIKDVHDCHVWSLDGNYHIMSIHIRLKEDFRLSELSEIKKKARNELKDESVNHITIETESMEENCELDDC